MQGAGLSDGGKAGEGWLPVPHFPLGPDKEDVEEERCGSESIRIASDEPLRASGPRCDLDEAVPCKICRVLFNGPLQYQDHLRSRFHRKRLKGARAARGAGRPSGAGEAGTSSSSGAQEAEADEAPERPPALRAGRPYAQGGPDKLG